MIGKNLCILSVVILTIGCSQKQPEVNKEQEDIKIQQERLNTQIVSLESKVTYISARLYEEQLKGKYLEAETGVLDKQILEILNMVDEYTKLGPQIGRASKVDVELAWKFVEARDNLVREKIRAVIFKREEYRKSTQEIWKKYQEDKKKIEGGN